MNITSLINALPGACAQGLIWGIMAIGVYITYKVLDLADLTVDGSMATGGAGDVLAGIIASLMAQGLEPYHAACLGVYLHGLAGDEAAARLGEHAMIASDIIDALPALLKTAEGI